MQIKSTYSWRKTVLKGLASLVVFAIPVLIGEFPEIANLTIGGIAVMLVNFIKYNWLTPAE